MPAQARGRALVRFYRAPVPLAGAAECVALHPNTHLARVPDAMAHFRARVQERIAGVANWTLGVTELSPHDSLVVMGTGALGLAAIEVAPFPLQDIERALQTLAGMLRAALTFVTPEVQLADPRRPRDMRTSPTRLTCSRRAAAEVSSLAKCLAHRSQAFERRHRVPVVVGELAHDHVGEAERSVGQEVLGHLVGR